MNFIFITSVSIIFYTFIGYPLLLRLVQKEKPVIICQNNMLPEITVVLCIYNCAHLLKNRIDNIFQSNYPQDKIKLLVVSDGSDDKPEIIISEFNNPSIKLLHYNENKGKSFALGYAKKHISTDFVAFTDARQTFDKDALKYLATKLLDNEIGAVSGNLKIIASDNAEVQGLYWKYEKAIRIKESDLHSLLGVTGAIYMAKTKLLPTLPENSLLDDMYIPLSIVKQGYKVKFCEQAIAYDTASISVEEEFTRKVRTLAGNFQLMKQLPWLLSFRQNPLFFQFFSHKVARLIIPFVLIALFISSIFISLPKQQTILALQLFFYSYTLLGYFNKNLATKLPLIGICISFCSLNLAALIAAWKYLTLKDITRLWKKH